MTVHVRYSQGSTSRSEGVADSRYTATCLTSRPAYSGALLATGHRARSVSVRYAKACKPVAVCKGRGVQAAWSESRREES